jgi:sec-independent protein translocase protein TatB
VTVFSNLSWYEVVALLLLALFIFGDKLPKMIADGLRMLRTLRRMAQNATSDLSRELGTDIQLEDLHPRSFVRKHLLSEEDQERLLQPLKGVSEDLKQVSQEADEATSQVRQAASGRAASGRAASGRAASGRVAGAPAPEPVAPEPPAPRRPRLEDIT